MKRLAKSRKIINNCGHLREDIMKFSFKSIVASVAISLLSTAAIAETVWQMPTPYPEANFHTRNIQQFAARIAEASKGELKIVVHPAGSLIKHAEIKNAARSGQVEIGEFIISNLANEDPIFALDAVPFLAASFEDSARLYKVSKEALTKKLAEQRLMPLFSVPWPGQGLYTDRVINTVNDLRGLKMRAYSPQTERLAQLLGAVPTQVEVPDLAQAFSTGRINAMITSTSTGVNASAWDFLTHFYDVSSFLPKNIIVVNRRAFERLSPELQKIVLDAAAAAEERGWKMAQEDHLAMRKVLEEKGIKVSNGSEQLNAALREIGKTMGQEWSKEAGATGAAIIKAFNDEKK